MGFQNVKSYVLTILSGIVLLAGVLLVILQWGNVSDFSLYGKNVRVNTALLMVASVAGGAVLWWMIKWLIAGVSAIRKARKRKL